MTRLELSALLAGRSRLIAPSAGWVSDDVRQKAADGRVRKRSGAIRCASPVQTKRFRCSTTPSYLERESLAHPASPASPPYVPTSPPWSPVRPASTQTCDQDRCDVDLTRVDSSEEESSDSDSEEPSSSSSEDSPRRRPENFQPRVLRMNVERLGAPRTASV